MDDQQPPDPAHVPVPVPDGVGDDAGRLLRFARDRHRAEVLAQRDVFLAAAQWAALHSQDSITAEHWMVGGDTAKPVAGAGCPLVAEFAIPEFAVVIGRSTRDDAFSVRRSRSATGCRTCGPRSSPGGSRHGRRH